MTYAKRLQVTSVRRFVLKDKVSGSRLKISKWMCTCIFRLGKTFKICICHFFIMFHFIQLFVMVPMDLEIDITFSVYLVLILLLCNTARSFESIFISFVSLMTHLENCLFKWSCPNADSNLATIKTLRIISSDSKWKTFFTHRTNYSALHCLPNNFLKTWGLKRVFWVYCLSYPSPPKS